MIRMADQRETSKDNRKRMHALSISILLFCILMLHSFLNLQNSYMDSELDHKQKELKRTAQIKAESVRKKYTNMLVSLEGLADNVKELTQEDEEIIASELKLLSKVGYFSYVGISDAQGNMTDSQGQTGNIKNRDYFKDAMNGNVTISDVLTSEIIPENEIQVIALPIVREEESVGIVFGILNIGEMDTLLENETGNYIYTQIVDSKGNYITRSKTSDVLTKNKNIWDDFEEYTFSESDIKSIEDDIKNQRSGTFSFRLDGEERVSFYMPLGVGNYYIYSTTNSAYIKSRVSEVSENVIVMILEMSVAMLILFWGIYKRNKFMHEKLKESHREVASSVQMIEIAVQESNQYIFEYDIETGDLRKKAGVENQLFSKRDLRNVPASIVESGIIDDASVADFKDMFEEIKNKASLESVIKVKTENAPQWFKVRLKNIYDEKRRIINTVGIVEDITEKKIQEELLKAGNQEKRELKKRAERDGLTGLYNAVTLKTKVTDILENLSDNPGPHLFVVMDLDNFKEINDSFGHQYGDKVLKEVAQVLQHTFRRGDIIARLGGDEFAVLLINAADYEIMKPIFEKLCRKLSKTYSEDGKTVKISASFGIAVAPEQGTAFAELYQKADLALYQVKNKSKSDFKYYQEKSYFKS